MSEEYDTLGKRYVPQIERLKIRADELAGEWQPLVERSKAAYAAGDGELAKILSDQYKPLNAECKALNAEANRMREQLHSTLGRVTKAFERAKQAAVELEVARLERLAANARPKVDGDGTHWDGGHETTRKDVATGRVEHYREFHTGDRRAEGWEYDPKTDTFTKFPKP
jgi:phage shock protein A